MKKFVFILLAAFALTATSCSSIVKNAKEPNVRFELTSHDYVLSDTVYGQATVTRVFNIDWARLFNTASGYISNNSSIIGAVLNADEYYALYDLLDKNPGYDFVMYPQTTAKTTGVPGIFTQTEVKISARLGKLKK